MASCLTTALVFSPVWMQEAMPLAVVGSDKEYQVNGKRVLGRKTAWGIVEGRAGTPHHTHITGMVSHWQSTHSSSGESAKLPFPLVFS